RLVAHDLANSDVMPDELCRIMAQVMVIGFAHDVDKLYDIAWTNVDAEVVADFIRMWQLDLFVERYGAKITPAHLLSYINAVEVRSSATSIAPGASNQLVSLSRRHIRFADQLASK